MRGPKLRSLSARVLSVLFEMVFLQRFLFSRVFVTFFFRQGFEGRGVEE